MFCKYCNADLKPEDKICPVCEMPVNGIENMGKQNVVNAMDNIPGDVMEGLDKSIFEPLVPQDSNVQESSVVEEQPIIIGDEPTVEQFNNNSFEQVNPPLVEPIVSNNNSNKHKNNMWMVPRIVAVFVVLMLIFSFFILRSPKMIFNQFINNGFKQISSTMVSNVENIKGSMSLETKISAKDESLKQMFDMLNNIYFAVDYEIDYENENALIKLNTKYNNEKLLDADLYLKDSKGYILLKDVYSKYLSTDVGDFSELFEKAEITNDHKVVISEIKKALNKSLKSEYFLKEKVDIKINGENKIASKNSLILTSDVINQIGKDFLTYLKEDEKFIESLSEVTEIDNNEITSTIEDALKSLDSNNAGDDDIKIVVAIYTNLMNKVVKVELETSNSGEKTTVEIIKESENSYSIVLNGSGASINGSLKILENTNTNTKVEFSITDPTSETTIGFILSTSLEYNQKLTNIDVSNNVDVNTLTEEEQNEIMTKLMESKGIQNLMSNFEGLMGNAFGYEDEFVSGDGVELIY